MKRFAAVLVWLVAMAVPPFLGFASIRLLISPELLRWEYGKASFPPDRYGFTREQRREYAQVAVEFLASPERPEEAIRLLAEQTHNGESLYNQRELEHMVDTKRLTDIIRQGAWTAGLIVLAGTALLAWRPETRGAAWQALLNGALLTFGILGGILAYILVGWRSFFTRFHQLLFPAGSWTFDYSETLIRLFPEEFWFDVGLMLAMGPLAAALAIWLMARTLGRRRGSIKA